MGKTEQYKAPSGFDYNEWAKRAGIGETRAEPPEANPDVLPAVIHEPTPEEEFIRYILDNPKFQLSFFTPTELVVFFAVFINGQPQRKVAALLGKKSPTSVQRIIARIQRKIKRGIETYKKSLV